MNLVIILKSSLKSGWIFCGAPDVLLHRLPEFIRLFLRFSPEKGKLCLSDGFLPDLVYILDFKTV